MTDPVTSVTSVTSVRDLDTDVATVFALLTDPARHAEFDASGTVGDTDSPGRLSAAGQLFTMHMSYRNADGSVDRYRTDNRVTMYAPDRLLEWSVAPHGGDPLGWRWRYEVVAIGARRTRVMLTYDWSGTPEENMEEYGVPLFTADDLAHSLDALATAVS